MGQKFKLFLRHLQFEKNPHSAKSKVVRAKTLSSVDKIGSHNITYAKFKRIVE